METKLVIFDLDGTLLDTISDIGRACNYALGQLGLPQHPVEAYSRMVGNGFKTLVKRAAPEASHEMVEKLVGLSREFYNDHCTETTHPYPGVPELLDELQKEGIWVAVASNKYRAAVETIVSHYFPAIRFVAVEGQRPGRPLKPEPDILDEIISKAGLLKRQVVFVGDSTVDIQTARRAGVTGMAVTWGFSPEEELKAANPDVLVNSADGILQFLK